MCFCVFNENIYTIYRNNLGNVAVGIVGVNGVPNDDCDMSHVLMRCLHDFIGKPSALQIIAVNIWLFGSQMQRENKIAENECVLFAIRVVFL